jgi:hypothetical protein
VPDLSFATPRADSQNSVKLTWAGDPERGALMTEPISGVFLSYASKDAAASWRIHETLRAGGIEVWFERTEPN